ncbi:hypothetical protein D3C73_1344040 [compost metagenome]
MLDVDLHAGFFNDLVDDFTASTDNIADFVRIDIDDDDLRRILGQAWSRLRDSFHHFAEDEDTSFSGLLQCFLQNLAVNSGNLDIHLNCGYTFCSTRYLKVHIS